MYHIFPANHYYEHPTDPNYLIFTFRREDMALHFANELTKLGIKFEKDEDVNGKNITLYLFAVKQRDRDKSLNVFMTTWGKFRKPFFSGTPVKYILLLLFLSLITLALIGIIKN